jgi:hypothetical protein
MFLNASYNLRLGILEWSLMLASPLQEPQVLKALSTKDYTSFSSFNV